MVPRVVLSLALLFSAATARCPLRFWNSMPIDAGFQISIYADSTCVGGCVKGDFWLAPEQAKPDTFGDPEPIFGEAVQGTPLDDFRFSTGALAEGRASAWERRPQTKTASASALLHDLSSARLAQASLRTCCC